ncbi:hypothetical protein D3C80_1729990 [compost metagenome]
MVVAGDRVHLGLAAQAAKGAGEDDPVMIFVKRAAAQFVGAVRRLAEAFAVEQCLPVQGRSSPFSGRWPLASGFVRLSASPNSAACGQRPGHRTIRVRLAGRV